MLKEVKNDPLVNSCLNSGAWFEHAINGVFSGNSADSRQKMLSGFVDGMELMLERDPSNPYDTNAIKIMFGKRQVGFVSAKPAQFFQKAGGLSTWLSDRIDKGEKWRVFVSAVVGGKEGTNKESYGCRVIYVMLSGAPFSLPSHYPLGEKDDNFQVWPEKSESTVLLEKLYGQWAKLDDIQKEQIQKWANTVKKFGGAPEGIRQKMREVLNAIS